MFSVLFPGQGSQTVGMLGGFSDNNTVASVMDTASAALGEDLAAMVAKDLSVRLEVVVPPNHSDLIPWLLAGKGDVIAANLTVTPEREKQVAFSTRYLEVTELIVDKDDADKISRPAQLAGQAVHVRRSSSYRRTLEALKKLHKTIKIIDAPEDMGTEMLIDAVANSEIPFTLADSNFVDMMRGYQTGVIGIPAFESDGKPQVSNIAFAMRPGSKGLKAYLDGFVKKNYRGLEYNVARKRYFGASRKIGAASKQRAALSGSLSPYDAIVKKYSARYGLDWRLMSAQAYVESRFNPRAKSWVGAKGLFQVMPRTGASLGFHDLEDPEQGTHAGIKYMDRLIKRFDKDIPLKQRVRFALAAYNAGLGHVFDARRLAAEKGWDSKRWFGNVEKAILLLQRPEYAKKARHGYCRGAEPVKYVSHIQSLYDVFVKAVND